MGVSWERAPGDWSCHARRSMKAAWDQAGAGRSWGAARPAMLAVQTPAGPGSGSGRSPRPYGWRHGPLVSDVTGLSTASSATGPGWRALGRTRKVERRRPGRVARMLPYPDFEIPVAFLQPDDRCPLVGDCRPELNNQCLQGGDHGWQHSTQRA